MLRAAGMIDSMVLRRAREEECHALSDLAFRSKAYWGYSAEFMEACRAELWISAMDMASPDCHYVVAESRGEILGYYALRQLSAEEQELEALFVDPEHIGQGVGGKLIEHAKSHAEEAGARFLRAQGDPNAADFYRAAGGIQVGERESDSVPGRYLPEFRIRLGGGNAG